MIDSPSGRGGSPEHHIIVRDVAATLVRHIWLILGVTGLIVALAAAYSYTRPTTYTAKAEVLVAPVLSSLDTSNAKNTSADTETRVATSLAVADIAKKALSSPIDAARLANRVTANMSQGSLILGLSYSARTPAEAQAGANAFADAYLSYREQLASESVQQKSASLARRLQAVSAKIKEVNAKIAAQPPNRPAAADLQNQIVLLQGSYAALQNQLVAVSSLTTNAGQVIQAAAAPKSPASPRHGFDLTLGVVIGLMLGGWLALVRDGPRHPIRYPDALENVLAAPVLASIPRIRRGEAGLVLDLAPSSHAAHAYRTLRAALLARCEGMGIKTILVTSAAAGDGKTATATNLGAALAEIGKQVVLVSGDLRRPRLELALGISKTTGLSEVLQEGMEPRDAIRHTRVPNLLVVSAGVAPITEDPANLLQSPRMAEMLVGCRTADYVIVDGPPVLEVSDAILLAQMSDGILFVVDGKTTDAGVVALARDHLAQTGTPIVGAVMIRPEMAMTPYRSDGPTRKVVAQPPVHVASIERSNGAPRQGETAPEATGTRETISSPD